jgi:hypothetical protein
MTNDDAQTVAASLSEIAEAVLRLATEIRDKNLSTTVVITKDEIQEPTSSVTATVTLKELPETPKQRLKHFFVSAEPTAAEEPSPAQAPEEHSLTPAANAVQERPRALRVEHQERVRESDGSWTIVSFRIYSDGVFREDRRPYNSPVGSPVGAKKI